MSVPAVGFVSCEAHIPSLWVKSLPRADFRTQQHQPRRPFSTSASYRRLHMSPVCKFHITTQSRFRFRILIDIEQDPGLLFAANTHRCIYVIGILHESLDGGFVSKSRLQW